MDDDGRRDRSGDRISRAGPRDGASDLTRPRRASRGRGMAATAKPRPARVARALARGAVSGMQLLAVGLVGLVMLGRLLAVPALALVTIAAALVSWTAPGRR